MTPRNPLALLLFCAVLMLPARFGGARPPPRDEHPLELRRSGGQWRVMPPPRFHFDMKQPIRVYEYWPVRPESEENQKKDIAFTVSEHELRIARFNVRHDLEVEAMICDAGSTTCLQKKMGWYTEYLRELIWRKNTEAPT